MPSVQTRVRYINPEWSGREEAPIIGDAETRRQNTSYFDIEVTDLRDRDDLGIGLETSGFELVEHQSASIGADDAQLRSSYRPEMAELIREVSGAAEVYVLGHIVRTEDQSDFNTAYARFVHCDYAAEDLETMSHGLLRKRGAEIEPGRDYAWYNTWQPFDHTVEQNPLAMIDVRSLAPSDMVHYRYTGYEALADEGRMIVAPAHNPDHRWYYYSAMTPGEVLLSKQNDGRPGRVVQCPHTSFIDDAAPADVPPRRSVETRVLAVF